MERNISEGELLEGNIIWRMILAVTLAVFHVESESKIGKLFGGKTCGGEIFWREKLLEEKYFGGKYFGG